MDQKPSPRLPQLHPAAAAAWPEIAVPLEQFCRHVEERLGDAASALTEERARDLYLACACAHGVAHAVEAFESHYGPVIEAGLASLSVPAGLVDDIRQTIRHRLLVAEAGERPKIAEYSGRGSFEAWLYVVTVRLALNRVRGERRLVATADEQLENLLSEVDTWVRGGGADEPVRGGRDGGRAR
jgi:RNA polymerase sigma-70 factor (ECF subfamily)